METDKNFLLSSRWLDEAEIKKREKKIFFFEMKETVDLFEEEQIEFGGEKKEGRPVSSAVKASKEIEEILAKTSLSSLGLKKEKSHNSLAITDPWEAEKKENSGEYAEHVVSLNDTLQGLALKYRVTVCYGFTKGFFMVPNIFIFLLKGA